MKDSLACVIIAMLCFVVSNTAHSQDVRITTFLVGAAWVLIAWWKAWKE